MAIQITLAASTTLTALANVRGGKPARSAPVLRKLAPGSIVSVTAIAAGEPVDGNALWFQLEPETYLWTGACGSLGALAEGAFAATAPLPAPLSPVAPVRAPAPAVPMVVDLYHGDAVTSFAQARAAGVRGVIHKATTGASGSDDLYAARRAPAGRAGVLWGAYHWGTAAPAAEQVENFLHRANPDDSTLVALDYERTNGNQMTLDRAREFLERLHDRLGRRAVIYSGNLIKEDLGSRIDPFFGAHRLWLAQYGPKPVVQRSWSTYWLWQYAERVAGIPGLPGNGKGELDLDHFAGTEDQLAAEWAS